MIIPATPNWLVLGPKKLCSMVGLPLPSTPTKGQLTSRGNLLNQFSVLGVYVYVQILFVDWILKCSCCSFELAPFGVGRLTTLAMRLLISSHQPYPKRLHTVKKAALSRHIPRTTGRSSHGSSAFELKTLNTLCRSSITWNTLDNYSEYLKPKIPMLEFRYTCSIAGENPVRGLSSHAF